jgi:uncharacterized RDD family membrane protein YckC
MYVERKSVKGPRIGAAVIDYIIFGIISGMINVSTTFMFLFSNAYYYRSSHLLRSLIIALVINLVFCFLYYTLFPYLTKGRTLGKLMVGVKVVSYDYSEAKFRQLFFRNIFFFEALIFNGFNLLFFYNLSRSMIATSSLFTSSIVNVLSGILNLVILIMILATSDERGLHDMIAKTVVVEKDFDLNRLNQANILERREMTWAEFDDEALQSTNNKKDQPYSPEDDEIEFLKED